MASFNYDLIVIGGGPAGVTAALRACELGASVALIERGHLGGICTNDGCVPTRVLAKTARLLRDAEQLADYGLKGQRPTLDFSQLLARTQAVIYQMHEKKQLGYHLRQAGVMLFENVGQARFSDEHTLVLPNRTRITGEKFILCTGGHARRLKFPGSEYTLTHTDVWSLKSLPKSIAIVGAAATGCQLASVLSAFGSKVTLLEVAPRILAGEDESVSQAVREGFERHGIEVITAISGIDRIEPQADQGPYTVVYKRLDQIQSLTVETVIVAVGWEGNSDNLGLEAAGIQIERSYITVNDHLQTTKPHIYAAGDITGRVMLVQTGSYEGQVAAENAILGPARRHRHKIVPHGGFTDPEYGSVGLTESQAQNVEDGCAVAVVPYADLDRAVIDGRTEGFCKLIVSRQNHRLLGAHVVGEQALEVVQLVAGGMASDMWVEQLAELELAYPTYTAILGLAARQLIRELGVTPLTPQWRALGKERASEWERKAK